jgi:hypothetical protein
MPSICRRTTPWVTVTMLAGVTAITVVGSSHRESPNDWSMANFNARPAFELPFACRQTVRMETGPTHDNFSGGVWRRDKALDMYNPPSAGTPVLASAAGRVIHISGSGTNQMLIDHGNRWYTSHSHLSNRVANGTPVARGERIGTMSNVGTGAAHLHYEQRYDANNDGTASGGELVRPVLHGIEYHLSVEGSPYSTTVTSQNCGRDRGAANDYNGDGTTDPAVYHQPTGSWSAFIANAGGGTVIAPTGWGAGAGNIPIPGDYNGDGTTDPAVYHQPTGSWSAFIANAGGGTVIAPTGWGAGAGNIPLTRPVGIQ